MKKRKILLSLSTLLFFTVLATAYAANVHDVAVIYINVWPTSTYPGQPIDIDVTVENQGDFKETFDVFVYAVGLENGPGIEIGSETVSLDVGASETLFFIWDTTDVPPGSYWVIAEAVLPKDVEPEDNIRRALVGGIYPRNIPKETNMLELLTSWGPIIVMMVGFAVSPIVIFEILMSQELRLPRYFSKRRQHNTTK